MGKQFTLARAGEILAAPGSAGTVLWDLLRALPAGADPWAVANGALHLLTDFHSAWRFARNCQSIPAAAIREVLRRRPVKADAFVIFLHAMVDAAGPDEVVEAQWELALRAWLDLQTSYGWGSKQKKQKLRALANSPDVVCAAQASAAGGGPLVPIDLLAVLAIDASDASMDALLAHFTVAASDKGYALQRLKKIKTHAAELEPMRAMLAGIDRKLSERSAASPALLLAADMGLGELKALKFSIHLGCEELNAHDVPRYQVSLTVDSQASVWFHFACTHLANAMSMERTQFNSEKVWADALDLGTCDCRELPQWLARAAKKLKVTWAFERVKPHTPLRGKKREAITRWLSASL